MCKWFEFIVFTFFFIFVLHIMLYVNCISRTLLAHAQNIVFQLVCVIRALRALIST